MDEILKRLSEIKAEAESLRDSTDADRIEKIQALLAERRELEVKLEAEKGLAELTAEVPVAEDVPEGDDKDEAPTEAPAEVEAPAEADPEDAAPESAEIPLAVAASATEPVDNEVPETSAEARPVALVASGNVAGTNPGTTLGVRDIDRIHRHAGSSRPREGADIKAIFASIAMSDGDSVNDSNTAEQNTRLMDVAKIGARDALTAAAAFCGPDDIVLDINAAGVASRPVQGLFRTVPVRGKFRYMKTATLANVAAGIDVWTEADQLALDPDTPATWKPCVDLSCRAETVVTPYAIPACTTMGVWQQLSAPEQITNWLTQMEKQYSKIAEAALLDRVRAQSFVFSAGATAQGLWTVLQALLAHSVSAVGYKNRDNFANYKLVAPKGFTAALAADEGMRGFSQNLAVQRILAILREDYGITVVESYEVDNTVAASYDMTMPALGGAATPLVLGTNTPGTYPIYLLNTDAFVAGDSSVVDTGYYRDANMVRQNLVRYFWEGMEFLEKTGDHLSFVYEINTCPNGAGAPVGADIVCDSAL